MSTLPYMRFISSYIYLNNLEDLYFCPETMGKLAQIGTLEEVVSFCKRTIDIIFKSQMLNFAFASIHYF